MQVFLDFDGPILDNRVKFHALHVALLQGTSVQPLPRNSYWSRKQNRVSEQSILAELGLHDSLIQEYVQTRQQLIEETDWLQFDRMWPYVAGWLAELSPIAELYLVTLRQNRANLLKQLDWLAIGHYFRAILSEDANGGTSDTKVRLINPMRCTETAGWIIGDTETDIDAGRRCQLRTIGVACGIRTPELLQAGGADFVVSDLSDVSPEFLGLGPVGHLHSARSTSETAPLNSPSCCPTILSEPQQETLPPVTWNLTE